MPDLDKEFIASRYRAIQDHICIKIAEADGECANFEIDEWDRPEGGGGVSRILQNGRILEKAGVNFSAVSGSLTEPMRESLKIDGDQFFATGVSIVMHPHNPYVPIIHMNIRYFEIDDGTYWFGGGIDLTPHYVHLDQARYFHTELKTVCDAHGADYYARFKPQADTYFYIPHRAETRGVGGIFYDHLSGTNESEKEALFGFSCDLGLLFPKVYAKLMNDNFDKPYSNREKEWQLIRRGRYAEFNLVYDRGTRFGLHSNGRTESILMSLPPQANWVYNVEPESDSPEGQTLQWLRQTNDWLNLQ